MLTRVTLWGALAAVAGDAEWILDVQSPGEALRAIECQVGKLFAHLIAKDDEGVTYRVVADGEEMAGKPELLVAPIRHYRTIDFIPVPAGAGGLWETIAGIALVAAGVIIAIASEGTLAWLSTPLITAGIGLVIGGVTQLFFGPKPPVAPHDSKDRGESADSTASYLFNGPVNTVGQGGAVPLLYGRLIVGGQTISSGIRTTSTDVEGEQVSAEADRQDKMAIALAIAATAGSKANLSNADKLKRQAEQAANS